MIRLRLSFAVGIIFGVLLASTRSYAQDLDSEKPLATQIQFRHLSGVGPVLLECKLNDKGFLRCRADRVLKNVECRNALQVNANAMSENPELNMGTGTLEKAENRAFLRGKVSGENVVCERRGTESLGSHWRISLLGDDGSYTEYSVGAANIEQSEQLNRSEMISYGRRSPTFDHGKVAVLLDMMVSGKTAVRDGLLVQGDVLPQVNGFLRYLRPYSGEENFAQEWGVGLSWELRPRTSHRHVPLVFFETGDLSRDSLSIGYSRVGGGLRSDWLGRFLTSELRASVCYPRVAQLRSAYRADMELQFGPFYNRRLGLDVDAFFQSELWTEGASNWSNQGIGALVSMNVFFGDGR